MSGAEQPKPMTREALRIQVLNFSASLLSPNCNERSVMELADKVWAWVEGDKAPPSKTTQAVARGVARLERESKPKE